MSTEDKKYTEEFRILDQNKLLREGIVIERPEEFGKSVFRNEYKKANELIKNIIIKKQNAQRDGYDKSSAFNVISFVGSRGSGKTSLMLSLLSDLSSRDDDECMYMDLQYIDISTLRKEEDIIAIILSRMLNRLDVMSSSRHQEALQRLYKRFDSIYKNLLNLNEKKRFVEGQSAFRTLQNLASSYTLAEEFKELVKNFIEYIEMEKRDSHGNKRYYLIIALDDIDLSNSGTYSLLEQIYEYLMVPGLIVLTTYNNKLLQKNCRNYLYEKFHNAGATGFYNTQFENSNRVIARERREYDKLVKQFLDKVLPINLRIQMPDFEKNENSNLLYIALKGDTENKHLAKEFILKDIAKKTQIYFDSQGQKRHFFEQRNLRDLHTIVCFLEGLKEGEKENLEENYNLMLEYIYNQFGYSTLTEKELFYLEELLEVTNYK